jgi:hypothetical protein
MNPMKVFLVLNILILLFINSNAQKRNFLSAGGGLTYPVFADNYDPSWYTSLHWNIGIGRFSYVDTHLGLAEIGVKNYPDVPGAENDYNVYQLGIGYRQYFLKHFFVRGGVAAAIINDGEASAQVFPNFGIGYDIFLTERHGLEFSFKNDLIRNFGNQSQISIFSFGAAYKFWYP